MLSDEREDRLHLVRLTERAVLDTPVLAPPRMLLPRVFASSVALVASLRSQTVVTCSAMGSLPSPVLDGKGAVLNEAALAGKRVALYFSAGWCPMCTNFEPSLKTFLQASEDSGKPITIIYVPSDRNEADAQAAAAGT